MTATIKENVYSEISQLKLRNLTKYDFIQFKELMLDSQESISTFIEMGRIVPNLNTVELMNFYASLLNDKEVEHFGVFHGWKMLAYASLGPAFNPSGSQIVYFVRQSHLRQNIGTFALGNLTRKIWLDKDLDFAQATIDKANLASRSVARSLGFEPLFALTALGQGTQASQTQIVYLFLNPRLKMTATAHDMRAVDLIGHFCFYPGLEHLIYDEKVNELFKWKFPIYQEDDLHLFPK